MKCLVTLFILLLGIGVVKGQDTTMLAAQKRDSLKLKHPQIIAYQFNRDFTSIDSIGIDTTLKRFQVFYKPVSERALNVFLGNLNLPYISVIYANRKPYNDFLFSQNIEYNFHQPEEIIYYKTWSPFTELTYYTGGPKVRQEQKLNILHTQNVNKNLNVGFLGDLNYSDGQYSNQRTKTNAFTLWAGYKGLRYSNYGNVSINSYRAQENGGISDDQSYLDGKIESPNIPVYLNGANVIIKRQSVFFNQRLYLTGSYKSDSLNKSSRWNEALSIIHRFQFDSYRRGYSDFLKADTTYYKQIGPSNFNNAITADTTYFRRIENTIQLAFNANDLLKVPAELRVGIKNQLDRYRYGSKLDSTKAAGATSYTANPLDDNLYVNTAFVGSLSNRFSRTLQWGASAEYYFTGIKAGNIDINGDIEKSIKKNVVLKLYGRFAVTTPGFMVHEFKSNHFSWTNSSDFPNQKTNTIRAGLHFSKFKFSIDAQLDNYYDFMFFGADAKPAHADQVYVRSLTLNKLIDWGFFHTDFRLTFQNSTNKDAAAIPDFSGFNSTYLEFLLFKVLQIQVGGDVFYNSSFYPNSYMPETGIFYSQNQIKTGKYPYADMFLNMKLKRFRFFLKYERVNTWFPNSSGYYLPHYPFNPSMLKYGISWTFYD